MIAPLPPTRERHYDALHTKADIRLTPISDFFVDNLSLFTSTFHFLHSTTEMCLGLIKFFRKIYWSEDSLFALKNSYVSENENTFIKKRLSLKFNSFTKIFFSSFQQSFPRSKIKDLLFFFFSVIIYQVCYIKVA